MSYRVFTESNPILNVYIYRNCCVCEIWGFHGSEVSSHDLCVVMACSDVIGYQHFRGQCFLLHYPEDGPLKRWYPTTSQHGVRTQKTVTWICFGVTEHSSLGTVKVKWKYFQYMHHWHLKPPVVMYEHSAFLWAWGVLWCWSEVLKFLASVLDLWVDCYCKQYLKKK